MKTNKPYPFNLMDDVMKDDGFYSELEDEEVTMELEKVLSDMVSVFPYHRRSYENILAVIRLYYIEGLSLNKIGNVLGLSPARIGQLKSRTLRILRHPSRLDRLLFKTDNN